MSYKEVLEAIEEVSAAAQSISPRRDWKESHDSVCKIYRMAHTALSLDCRKNHPGWTRELAKAMRKA